MKMVYFMICYIFKLDEYFVETDKYYHFFDSLFSYNKCNKDNILISLNIIPSSYRVERTRSVVKNNNISILLDYFGYSKISKEMQIKYEALFAKIYYCCYYKSHSSFDFFINELNEFLKEKNVLYPIVVLFKVFLYANMEMDLRDCKVILKDELDYLKSFYDTKYFTEDLQYLYLSMLYFFNCYSSKNADILNKIKEYSIRIPKLSWLCLNVRASKEYLSRNPKDAIALFSPLAEEYKENNNMIRYFHTINNLASLYNIINEYEYSLKYTSKVIEYLFSSTEHEKWITYILTHYLYSLLQLKKYNEILQFIDIIIFDKKYLSDISATICLIASRELGFVTLSSGVEVIAKKYRCYNIVKKYYETMDTNYLKELGTRPYPAGIYTFLTEKTNAN